MFTGCFEMSLDWNCIYHLLINWENHILKMCLDLHHSYEVFFFTCFFMYFFLRKWQWISHSISTWYLSFYFPKSLYTILGSVMTLIVVVIRGVLVVGIHHVLLFGLGTPRDRWFISVCSFLVKKNIHFIYT